MNKRDSAGELSDDEEQTLAEPPFPESDKPQDALAVGARPLNSAVRGQSLADLARRSVAQRQATGRELARASMTLSSRSGIPLEDEATRRDDVSRTEIVASSPNAVTASTLAPSEARATPHRVAVIEQAASPLSELPWLKISLGVGVLALATAVALWLRGPKSAPGLAQATATSNANNAAGERSSPVITPLQQPADRETPASAEANRGAVELSSLAQEETAKPGRLAKPAASEHAKAAQPRAAEAPDASESSPAAVTLEDAPARTAVALGLAAPTTPLEKSTPQVTTPPLTDDSSEAVPMKPSTGAVQAALGAVMSGARRCVVSEDAASSAVVVFASDGRVQSVNVSGPAAGRPSGACIQGQLSRARLQPFRSATFSVSATVRPD